MLIQGADALTAASVSTLTVTADAQLIGANPERNGLQISNIGATNPLFLLLGSGTTSASNAHVVVPAGQTWPGMVGGVVWRGAVRGFSTTTPVGISEV